MSAKILVVDDNATNLDVLGEVLRSKGYTVDSASDGAEAMAKFKKDPPHMVLLDLRMPGLTGFDVLSRMRVDPAHGDIPILILSGSEDLPTKVQGLDAGADDFLTKPVEPKELIARVRAHLRARDLTEQLKANLERARQFAEFSRHVTVLDRSKLSETLKADLPALLGVNLFSLYVLTTQGEILEHWADNHPSPPLDQYVDVERPGMMSQAVKSGLPVIVSDYSKLDFPTGSEEVKYTQSFAASYPLLLEQGSAIGVLNLNDLQDGSFDPMDQLNVSRMSDQLALVVNNILMHERAQELSRRDSLTGLLNHATFQLEMDALFNTAARYNRDLSVVMVDLDHFKLINDKYGHLFGDKVLVSVGWNIRQLCRQADISGRYGGEEFILVLPETDLEGAVKMAERLREGIKGTRFLREGLPVEVRASAGVSSIASGRPRDKAELIQQADQALYLAKRNGRDRVETFAA
ncbi:MAG: diguanylate cyclase [Nitrospirae bacterium]|nr:diguanylate cyclase [Nitrospirota bacterium]